MASRDEDDLRRENEELRARLNEVLNRSQVRAPVMDALCRRMVEEMALSAVALDTDGVILYANACFADLMKLDRESMVGTSIFMLVPDEARSFFRTLQQPDTRSPQRRDLVLRRHGGGMIPVFATMSRFQLHELDLFCLTLTDLRARGSHEALAIATRGKHEFLATLAYELRNPITPIRNVAQMLGLTGLPEPRIKWARDVIDRQVMHMSRVVDDLLDVSRITRGKIRLDVEPTILAVVVSRAIDAARPLIDKHRHRLNIDLPSEVLPVCADIARLSQAISNILGNAAKFTPDGGAITLRAERRGSWVVISIRDTGIGIAPDMLPIVFDLFTQAAAGPGRAQGGLGIGLTLARRLVEMHGGTVEASSEGLGKGSELIVRLPAMSTTPEDADERAPAGEQPHLSAHQAASPRRILIVDDNQDSSESLMLLLAEWGHEVRTALDAESALEQARTFRPQMMFVDIGLPGMNGYDLARAVRAMPGMEDVVLVAVTGYNSDEDRRASLEAGFDDHWVKPIDLGALSSFTSDPDAAS
jgi:PAS domain S-box-containing protein